MDEKYLRRLKLARDLIYTLNNADTSVRSEILQQNSFHGVPLIKIAGTLAGFSDSYHGYYQKNFLASQITAENIEDFFNKCFRNQKDFNSLRDTVIGQNKSRQTGYPYHGYAQNQTEIDEIDQGIDKFEELMNERKKGDTEKDTDKDDIKDAQSEKKDEKETPDVKEPPQATYRFNPGEYEQGEVSADQAITQQLSEFEKYRQQLESTIPVSENATTSQSSPVEEPSNISAPSIPVGLTGGATQKN